MRKRLRAWRAGVSTHFFRCYIGLLLEWIVADSPKVSLLILAVHFMLIQNFRSASVSWVHFDQSSLTNDRSPLLYFVPMYCGRSLRRGRMLKELESQTVLKLSLNQRRNGYILLTSSGL